MAQTISPQEAQVLVRDQGAVLIDVRDPEEFAALRISGALLKPLSVIRRMPKDESSSKPAVFFCRSGNRTGASEAVLDSLGHPATYILEGGLMGWQKAGLPVASSKVPLPLMRQVHIAAGLLILIFLILGQAMPFFRILAAFVGAGLLFSGLTGACGMALLLRRMPWNKAPQ